VGVVNAKVENTEVVSHGNENAGVENAGAITHGKP